MYSISIRKTGYEHGLFWTIATVLMYTVRSSLLKCIIIIITMPTDFNTPHVTQGPKSRMSVTSVVALWGHETRPT